MMKNHGLLCGFLFVTALAVADSGELLRETLAAAQSGARPGQAEKLSGWISDRLTETLRPRPDEVAALATAADCITYLNLTEGVRVDPAFEAWLFSGADRLRLLAKSVLPADNLHRVFQWLETLTAHDPADKDEWFELMLALAVVWDRPQRPLAHRQMGKELLPYQPDLTARYDYFKSLYASGDAKIPYGALSVADLVFVVETPVPVSELQWARDNEDGELKEWGDKFSDIAYDHYRLSSGGFQWPNGLYTLEAIRRRGGICVDQTYYAVMTARAFGIPAFCIHAPGKSGSHAWFSYMSEPGRWALNVGRYESEAYTTGRFMHPQTNKQMSDHDIALGCERRADRQAMLESNAFMDIAACLTNHMALAVDCAGQARKLDPLNRRAWMFELDARLAEDNPRKLLRLFDDMRDAFKEHPDVVLEAAEKVCPALEAAGMDEEAGRLRRHLARKVEDDRDDLARFMGMDKIEVLVDEGEIKKARRKMEDILEDHIGDGSKAFPMIYYYLKITKNTDQSKAAAKFMEEYIADMFEAFYFDIARRKAALKLLLQAYTQARDEDGIAETKNRLSNL